MGDETKEKNFMLLSFTDHPSLFTLHGLLMFMSAAQRLDTL